MHVMYQSNAELDVRYNSVHVCTDLCMYQVNYSEEMQQVCVQVVVECVAVEVRKANILPEVDFEEMVSKVFERF